MQDFEQNLKKLSGGAAQELRGGRGPHPPAPSPIQPMLSDRQYFWHSAANGCDCIWPKCSDCIKSFNWWKIWRHLPNFCATRYIHYSLAIVILLL